MNEEIKQIIKDAFKEDMPNGDVTSDAIFKEETGYANLIAKEDGIIGGIELFDYAFMCINSNIKITWKIKDGDYVKEKEILATIKGKAIDILKAERVALNLMQRVSGIATLTNQYVQEVKGYDCDIYDTRKTTPNFRAIEKYSVLIGSGHNHRFNLSDQVMIKDNHIQAAGSISNAVKLVKEHNDSNMIVEVECETLEQVKEAVDNQVDIIMLDNMGNDLMVKCVEIIGTNAIVEASGNMNLSRVKEVAATGVNRISIGALTHSYRSFDISLKFKEEK